MNSTNLILTLVDTSAIQNYVFNSNLLMHQAGASGLVHAATNDWVFDALLSEMSSSNIQPNKQVNEKQELIKDDLDAELIYTGGGNALLLFRDIDLARKFTRALTLRAVNEAGGLELVVVHHNLSLFEEKGSIKEAMNEVLKKVWQKKRGRRNHTPTLGLGVTAECQFTGLPAVGVDRDRRYVSRQIQQTLDFFAKADQRLRGIINNKKGIQFLYDFSDLGEEGKQYMAVIHTDGNGMSERARDILETYHHDYREYIIQIRKFSGSIRNASEIALNKVFDYLVNAANQGLIKVKDNHLPFRPIVFGGDDNTFVCTGKLGIPLAALFIRELAKIPLSDGKPISARAGIAIVKTHYPFSKAYHLAEELAQSAKDYRKDHSDSIFSAIDWHIANSGPITTLDEIRRREYISDDGHSLSMRPIHILSPNAGWRSLENLTDILEGLENNFERGHNKLKEMREYFRYGPDATKVFLNNLEGASMPEIPNHPTAKEDGWINNTCCYFDAVELLGHYEDVEGEV